MKERLIGAAVLVALGVWLIPWVLDGPEPRSEDGSVALELPTSEEAAPMRTQTIRLDERHVPPGPAEAGKPAAEPAEPRIADRAVALSTRAEVSPEPERSASRGGWAVQLGSFSDEENAQRLAHRVATYGYSPKVSDHRTGGRLMHRVRVGPQESKERAAQVASALTAHGFPAQVVPAD